MSTLKKIISFVAIALAIAVGAFLLGRHTGGNSQFVGAVGTGLPIENYVPAVLYNGGLYSALPAQFGSTVTHSGAVTNSSTVTNSGAVSNTSTVTTGSTGTALSKIIAGTTTCAVGSVTIAAVTTATYDCAATGIIWPDSVVVTLATSTPTWIGLVSANASSTTGFFQIQLRNSSTTGAAIAVAGATSSVQYWAFR